jgi:hypothetical protein
MPDRMKVERSQLVDLIIPVSANFASIKFPDQPMLRNKRITGIEVFTVDDIAVSPISSTPLMAMAAMRNMFLTAYMGDPQNEQDTGEYLYRIPLISLHQSQNPGVTNIFAQRVLEFDELNFQFEKCEVDNSIPFPVPTPLCILFNIFYDSKKARPHKGAHGKVSGIEDEDLTKFLMAKIMMLEEGVKKLLGGGKK